MSSTKPIKTRFDSLSLLCAVHELQGLAGARIQRITQPNQHDVVISLYEGVSKRELHWLISCSPQWARTHLVSSRPAKPDEPLPFGQELRRHIGSGRIISIQQRGFDRVLDVAIAGLQGRQYLLTAEFMARHSNIILVSPEGWILQPARPVSKRVNRVREVLPGRVYLAPPQAGGQDPHSISESDFGGLVAAVTDNDVEAWLMRTFQGISPLLAAEIKVRISADGRSFAGRLWTAFSEMFEPVRRHAWKPVLIVDQSSAPAGAYPLPLKQLLPPYRQVRQPFQQALEQYYEAALPAAELSHRRQTLGAIIAKESAYRREALRQIQQGRGRSPTPQLLRERAGLILAHLHEIEPGQTSLHATAEETGGDAIIIGLDAQLTPAQNADGLFRRARKAEANAGRLAEAEARLQEEQTRLDRLGQDLEAAQDAAAIESVKSAGARSGLWPGEPEATAAARKSSDNGFEGRKIRVLQSPDGYEVLVGQNALANDYLVQRVARPDDWWLHVRAGTSAHVVIRTNGAPQRVPPTTLTFAAQQSAAGSPSKHAAVVAVDYTLKKYVRRPRGAAPGTVTLSHEKTLHVRSEIATEAARSKKR